MKSRHHHKLLAMLNDCHELQTLYLGSYVNAVSAKGLASLTHIRGMELLKSGVQSTKHVCCRLS